LLATSRTEGFFIPGLEAMASGCLFVTTNNRGVLDYAKNNRNSIIVSSPDEIWTKDIIENLIENPLKINYLIKEGYKTANKYSVENIVDELEELLIKN
jgi:glycosyltransferase involved in cell wall biosynthesis